MEKWMNFLDKVIAACDAYGRWYNQSRWGDYNVQNCVFCNNDRKNLILSAPSLVSYRYQNSRVNMRVTCPRCGGKMLATTLYGSKKWTYFIN